MNLINSIKLNQKRWITFSPKCIIFSLIQFFYCSFTSLLCLNYSDSVHVRVWVTYTLHLPMALSYVCAKYTCAQIHLCNGKSSTKRITFVSLEHCIVKWPADKSFQENPDLTLYCSLYQYLSINSKVTRVSPSLKGLPSTPKGLKRPFWCWRGIVQIWSAKWCFCCSPFSIAFTELVYIRKIYWQD